MRSNSLSWCPTFPTTILLASEDHNLYTFDIRQMKSPSQIYKGHVSAVMSAEWAPTGLEFVSGSWDRTVRIWKEGVGKSRDVYHTKRMQRLVPSLLPLLPHALFLFLSPSLSISILFLFPRIDTNRHTTEYSQPNTRTMPDSYYQVQTMGTFEYGRLVRTRNWV